MAWDISSLLVSGVVVAMAYSALNGDTAGTEASILSSDLVRTATTGAFLSPLLLRDRLLRRLDAALVKTIVRRVVGLLALTLTFNLLIGAAHHVPMPWALGWFMVATVSMVTGRALAAASLRWTARRFGGERVAIIGRGAEADWLHRTIRKAGAGGIDLIAQSRRAGMDGIVADLVELGRHGMLDRVVLAHPGLSNAQVQRIAHRLKALRIEVTSLFPLLGAGGLRPMTELASIPLFVISRRPQWGYGGLSKQVLDRGLAVLLLLWTLPLLLLLAAAIRLDSPGPVLFRQRRHGVNGAEFDIFKFRTMVWQGQGSGSGAVQTGRHDRRITRVGRLLRQSSLDEVPQLLNVLNGTMSLVGPRPHPTAMRTEDRLGDEISPEYPHRHRVKPGITGWAQVNGLRGATETVDQLRRRIEYDNYYIENWSPWFDLRILAMTPVSLLLRRANAF